MNETIILPGFSPTNRQWAIEAKEEMGTEGGALIHEWKHWDTQNPVRDFKNLLPDLGSNT